MTDNHDRFDPFCLWLNGPANKDRSTLADLVRQTLSHRGAVVQLLDSTRVFERIGAETLLPEDMVKILTWTVKLLMNYGVTVVLAQKNNDPDERAHIKNEIPGLFEVSLGLSQNPDQADLMLDPGTESVKDCLARILRALELLGFAPPAEDGGYSDKEAELVAQRLKELGYI